METRHAPLRALLDPVRRKLPGHPTLERVAATGRLVADDDFRMQIPGSGRPMAAWALNAGPMGRATELSGDRFWTAQRELNAFRSQAGGRAAVQQDLAGAVHAPEARSVSGRSRGPRRPERQGAGIARGTGVTRVLPGTAGAIG